MVKFFVMRLMYMGFNVYIVGEIFILLFCKGDFVIIGLGLGEIKSLIYIVVKVNSLDGVVVVLIINLELSIGK